ncbi:gp430 [Bacillus phage G]|uniref:Gp430 n=1 Tax=Bacillus phage G TaxID=2884420 RepID=G3MAH1_9CAUD|nr:gp430 [Bacillus phage G]AEO93688.1 gp430 [Bacillus phage G]
MDGFEIIRDPILDRMFEEIISIFKLEGVDLVRLSGLTKWCKKHTGRNDIPAHSVDSIIRKMQNNNVIQFDYVIKCPHCGETSYIINHKEDFLNKPKLCDTCSAFYTLIDGANLEKIKRDQ